MEIIAEERKGKTADSGSAKHIPGPFQRKL
jgi:hypothetical protein